MASQHHPDKPGGDKEKFQQVEMAYRILSDDERKERYDRLAKFKATMAESLNAHFKANL